MDQENRRSFLKRISAGESRGGECAVGEACPAAAASPEASEPKPIVSPGEIPRVTIAGVRIPRMIIGCNPIGGWSHAVPNMSRAMTDYFTLERTVEFLKRCERTGLDVWLSYWADKPLNALKQLWAEGYHMRPYFLGKLNDQGQLTGQESGAQGNLKEYKPIFFVHHGGVTDHLFSAGKHELVHTFVKKVHDELGIPAGVSAHNPENIAYIEEKGWEVDFYQTCLYNLTRPKEQIRAKLGTAMLGEPFLESDRDEMLKVIGEVKKPCLAFKILAAGWHCESDRSVEAAFAYALKRIKKSDAVIVGFWPKYKDELAQDVGLLCKYGGLSRQGARGQEG